jgi:hypothetical protein
VALALKKDDLVIAQEAIQGQPVVGGGPQQVDKHATDLVHVLNQAKVEFNPEMKFESIQFIFKFRRCLGPDVFGLQVEDIAQGRLQG